MVPVALTRPLRWVARTSLRVITGLRVVTGLAAVAAALLASVAVGPAGKPAGDSDRPAAATVADEAPAANAAPEAEEAPDSSGTASAAHSGWTTVHGGTPTPAAFGYRVVGTAAHPSAVGQRAPPRA